MRYGVIAVGYKIWGGACILNRCMLLFQVFFDTMYNIHYIYMLIYVFTVHSYIDKCGQDNT